MKTIIKRPRWTRSKTQIFAVVLIVLGGIQANMGIFTGFFTAETIGLIGSVIGTIVYILRGITTCSLESKEEEVKNE